MRRREVITFIGGAGSKRPVKLVTAAILCFAGVYAEAAEIHNGDTGYIAKNSIWFTDESAPPDLLGGPQSTCRRADDRLGAAGARG